MLGSYADLRTRRVDALRDQCHPRRPLLRRERRLQVLAGRVEQHDALDLVGVGSRELLRDHAAPRQPDDDVRPGLVGGFHQCVQVVGALQRRGRLRHHGRGRRLTRLDGGAGAVVGADPRGLGDGVEGRHRAAAASGSSVFHSSAAPRVPETNSTVGEPVPRHTRFELAAAADVDECVDVGGGRRPDVGCREMPRRCIRPARASAARRPRGSRWQA